MTWPKFKDFFQKNVGDFRAFVNDIWSKMKIESQYQHKSVQEWATHLKYLQSILLKFDAKWASAEDTKICYFRKSLKPSVWAKIEQRSWELNSFEEFIQKAVDADAKAALQPHFYICNADQYCF